MIVMDSDLQPTINQKAPRKVFRFNKANLDKAYIDDTIKFNVDNLPSINNRTAQENWSLLRECSFISL